jgi:two-component system chemotaxis sensor kinase CheA
MENGLLGMDPGDVDEEEINAIFRAAHSIKGGSGTFGFSTIANFTHLMETLLDGMRDRRRPVTAEAIAVLLRSVDLLREMLNATCDQGDMDQLRIEAQQQELNRMLSETVQTVTEGATFDTDNEPEMAQEGWHIVFRPLPHMFRTGNDP